MGIAEPLSDQTFLLVEADALGLKKEEYKDLLVRLGFYSLRELEDPFELGRLTKKQLIRASFEDHHAWPILVALYEQGVFSKQTLAAMEQDGVRLEEEDGGDDDASGAGRTTRGKSSQYANTEHPHASAEKSYMPDWAPGFRDWFRKLPVELRAALVALLGSILICVGTIIASIIGIIPDFFGIYGGPFATDTIVPSSGSTPSLEHSITPSDLPGPSIQPSPTSSPTGTPTPVPTVESEISEPESACRPTGSLVVEEDFQTNYRKWPIAQLADNPFTREERAVREGSYRFSAYFKEEAFTTSAVPDFWGRDLGLQFDATLLNKSGEGIARFAVKVRQSGDEFYLARFGDDGFYSLQYWKNDSVWQVIEWTESDAFDLSLGRTNQFSILANGFELTLCANGRLIESVADPKLNSGGNVAVGLSATPGLSIVALFDNVAVYVLNENVIPTLNQSE